MYEILLHQTCTKVTESVSGRVYMQRTHLTPACGRPPLAPVSPGLVPRPLESGQIQRPHPGAVEPGRTVGAERQSREAEGRILKSGFFFSLSLTQLVSIVLPLVGGSGRVPGWC